MFKKIWNDPVGSKVIASFIITALGSGIVYLFGLWPWVKSWIFSGIAFLGESSPIPHWLLLILAIPTLMIGWVLLLLLVDKVRGGKDYTYYVSDSFIGLQWEWQYGSYGIWNIHCFCPECKFQITPEQTRRYGVPTKCEFECPNCYYQAPSFDGSYHKLEDHIKKRIHHRIRTGEWVETLESPESKYQE